jgi:hypothetical protein
VFASPELAPLIRDLSDENSANRQHAAFEIFARGRELARSALANAFTASGVADSFILGADGFPLATVGVAVEPATFARIRTAAGSPRLADVPADQDAVEFELEFPDGARLDILTRRDPPANGAIARYLQRSGEGIQQVELQVRDVDRATEMLRSHWQVDPVYPATRPGADDTRVNFFLVPLSDGRKVLIELVDARATKA